MSRNVKDKKKMSNAILALFRIQCDEPKSNVMSHSIHVHNDREVLWNSTVSIILIVSEVNDNFQ